MIVLKAQYTLKDGDYFMDERRLLKLRAARVNAELTQAEAAKMAGISKNTLSNYESYKTKPDIETAKKLAFIYGVSVNDIIFFTH